MNLLRALEPALWVERQDERTPTARVWQHAIEQNRRYCVVRQSTHCFGDALESVIDYRLHWTTKGWKPNSSPFPVRMERKGEHLEIAGAEFELLDFGMMKGGWVPLLKVRSESLKITPRYVPYKIDPTFHASYIDGAVAPGVSFHAAISAKGYGKELRFARAAQTEYFSRLEGAEFFGFRYRMKGDLSPGWMMQKPRMFVRRRGGQADGFYRRDGEFLYALFARSDIDARLLPGEWIVDPAITQESVVANADDCYEGGGTNTINGYNGRDYAGNYATITCHAGLRFQTIPIPADATGMNSSTIRVFRESLSGTPNLTIYGDDQDDAPAWAAGTGTERPNGAGVTRTTASAAWNSSFGAGNNQYVTTPSIAPVTDEIIQRAGWASGNDIRFVFINSGASGNYITWNDFNNNSTTEEATFDADYIAAAGGGSIVSRSPFAAPIFNSRALS